MSSAPTDALAPTEQLQVWFARVTTELPRVLRASWAQELVEAIEGAGVERAEQIDGHVLEKVASARAMSVEALLALTKRCPLGISLANLF
jgi:hypothetical protein